jgi:hypothetical protein
MPEQKPTVGRIVHYVLDHDENGKCACLPAIITKVDSVNQKVCLTYFPVHELPQFDQRVPQDETKQNDYSWHWPEREEY